MNRLLIEQHSPFFKPQMFLSPSTKHYANGDRVTLTQNIHLNFLKIILQTFLLKKIPEFAFYESLKPEVKYGVNSRIDFLLQKTGTPDGYLEIKNVHYKKGDTAYFPDCVTARGAKHLKELSLLASQGIKCFVLYVLQIVECHYFDVAREIDPVYAKAAVMAKEQGVEFLAYSCALSLEEIFLDKKIEVK